MIKIKHNSENVFHVLITTLLCFYEIGVCVCEPGSAGNDCEKVCPPGTYGVECNLTCRCQNESKCRGADGICLCEPGFSGPTCSEGELNIVIIHLHWEPYPTQMTF